MKKVDWKKIGEKVSTLANASMEKARALPTTHPKLYQSLQLTQSRWQNLVQKYGPEKLTTIGAIIASTYFVADMSAILLQKAIPDFSSSMAPRSNYSSPMSRRTGPEDYEIITSRNLVSSRGLIPEEVLDGEPGGVPVRTSLPFDLVGTVILQDAERSLATIQDRSADRAFPVQVGDEIPGKAKITSVEARKVIFVNLQNRRNEYVDLPEDDSGPKPVISTAPTSNSPGGVKKLSSSRVVVDRKKLDTTMKSLDRVLTEARVVPNPGGGFKIFQIVNGSIYEELGLKDNDVLKEVNGEPIDASKAFGMLNELNDTKHVELTVNRNGQEMKLSYDIE